MCPVGTPPKFYPEIPSEILKVIRNIFRNCSVNFIENLTSEIDGGIPWRIAQRSSREIVWGITEENCEAISKGIFEWTPKWTGEISQETEFPEKFLMMFSEEFLNDMPEQLWKECSEKLLKSSKKYEITEGIKKKSWQNS